MPSRRKTLSLLPMTTVLLSGCLDDDSVTPRLYAVDITNETDDSQSVLLQIYDGDETIYERSATVQADIRRQFAVPIDERGADTVDLTVESLSESRAVELSTYATADAPCVHPVFEMYESTGLISDTKAYTDCDDRPTLTPANER